MTRRNPRKDRTCSRSLLPLRPLQSYSENALLEASSWSPKIVQRYRWNLLPVARKPPFNLKELQQDSEANATPLRAVSEQLELVVGQRPVLSELLPAVPRPVRDSRLALVMLLRRPPK